MTGPFSGKRHGLDSRFKMKRAKAGMYSGSENPMYGKRHSDAARASVSAARTGTRWIHLGSKGKQVKVEELESYTMAGWDLGRPSSSSRR